MDGTVFETVQLKKSMKESPYNRDMREKRLSSVLPLGPPYRRNISVFIFYVRACRDF